MRELIISEIRQEDYSSESRYRSFASHLGWSPKRAKGQPRNEFKKTTIGEYISSYKFEELTDNELLKVYNFFLMRKFTWM